MAATYVFAVEGLDALKSIDEVPEQVLVAARQAVNRTVDRARTAAAREIGRQVNLSASYLSNANGRLSVVKKAQGKDLEGVVRGRQRPVSLARFVRGAVTPGKRPKNGIRVEVKPGKLSSPMKGAFLMKLRAGTASIDTRFNLGLAVRTRTGQKPSKAYKPLPIGKNLFLLYGPSVDQVFRSVAPEIAPAQAAFLETEFRRLMALRNA